MKTKTYIVFYKFYEKEIDGIKGKSTEGFGWIDNIQVTRKRKEKFDILEILTVKDEFISYKHIYGG